MTTTESVPSRASNFNGATHRLLRWAVGTAVVALVAETWLVEGLLTPVVVASGSMAPALVGPHRHWLCRVCQQEFVCGLESLPAPQAPAACPNCGTDNDPQAGDDRPGQRVLVDRSAFLWRAPQRWEAIVFRCPDDARTLCVKRVIGLPGESVQIVEGDIYVNGAIAAKNLAAGRALAVSVYAASESDRRWQSSRAGAWERNDEGGFVHPAPVKSAHPPRHKPSAPSVTDWLVYHHRTRDNSGERGDAIRDGSPYDQSESRALTAVSDVLLSCQMRVTGSGAIYLRALSRGDEFVARLDVASGEGELFHNGQPVALLMAPTWALALGRFATLELMVADRRVSVAMNGSELIAHDYQPADSPPPNGAERRPVDQPLAIGAEGLEVEARELQVWRDVHYTAGPGSGGQSQFQLGANEYLLLGDNSPQALDSRAWSGLDGALLVGRVLSW